MSTGSVSNISCNTIPVVYKNGRIIIISDTSASLSLSFFSPQPLPRRPTQLSDLQYSIYYNSHNNILSGRVIVIIIVSCVMDCGHEIGSSYEENC